MRMKTKAMTTRKTTKLLALWLYVGGGGPLLAMSPGTERRPCAASEKSDAAALLVPLQE